jgi:hypothetical protein
MTAERSAIVHLIAQPRKCRSISVYYELYISQWWRRPLLSTSWRPVQARGARPAKGSLLQMGTVIGIGSVQGPNEIVAAPNWQSLWRPDTGTLRHICG